MLTDFSESVNRGKHFIGMILNVVAGQSVISVTLGSPDGDFPRTVSNANYAERTLTPPVHSIIKNSKSALDKNKKRSRNDSVTSTLTTNTGRKSFILLFVQSE